MKNPIERYRPFGDPATAVVTIPGVVTNGDKVTINGVDFIAGTHFLFDKTAPEIAESLAESVNGGNAIFEQRFTDLVRPCWAYYTGNSVVLVATKPGTGGNALTLAQTGSSFVISGANFTGGTAGTTDSLGGGAQDSTLQKIIPATLGVAVVPDDATVFAATRSLYIGGTGDVTVVMAGGGAAVTFSGVPIGTILPISVTQVKATGTTATNIVALS